MERKKNEQWIVDSKLNKLRCTDALWDMTRQWLRKHPDSKLDEKPKMAKLLARSEGEELTK